MRIIIAGGGICGLGTALLLARDGHDVTVLESDGNAPPASHAAAWDGWPRKGVAQFRQPHNLMPGLRVLLDAELPDVQQALVDAGAARWDLVNPLPPVFADRSPRAVDEQLWTWTARRPVAEWAFADAAGRQKGLDVCRGVRVAELVAGASVLPGAPHVVGVRTEGGDALAADLVVDATGRQSRGPQWLRAIGAAAPAEEQADCGFTYYTRYFQGRLPQRLGPTLTALGTISLLTLLGDNDTWSVTIFAGSGDQALKTLRRESSWTNVVRACPLHAHWLDGEPLTDVLPMGGIVDRYRRFVVDSRPVATGFVAVADALACTNPSAGRGLTVGFKHAAVLRDVLREAGDDFGGLAGQFDARTEAEITPWYRAQIAADRARFAEMDGLRAGAAPSRASDSLATAIATLFGAMMADPDLFRAALEYVGTLTPVQEILARPDVTERIRNAHQRMRGGPPRAMPGPTREQLLELVA